MSEIDNVWRISAAEQEHEIVLEDSTMTGRTTVTLDGVEVGNDRMLAGSERIEFSIDGVPAVAEVILAHGSFSSRSELHVAGRYVEPLTR